MVDFVNLATDMVICRPTHGWKCKWSAFGAAVEAAQAGCRLWGREWKESNCMRDLNELRLQNQHHRRSDISTKKPFWQAYWLNASHISFSREKDGKNLFNIHEPNGVSVSMANTQTLFYSSTAFKYINECRTCTHIMREFVRCAFVAAFCL